MIYVYDPSYGEWLMENTTPDACMPGMRNWRLPASDFQGPSLSSILWSDRRALEALEELLVRASSLNVRVRYAFRRPGEGMHSGQSAHYAGLAFDVGHNLKPGDQMFLAGLALRKCGFDRIEPPFITPGWLHVEKEIAPSSGAAGGYPILRKYDKGVHVFVLQDALLLHGLGRGGMTGCFSTTTATDVRRFQKERGIPATGVVDGSTWHALMCSPKRGATASRLS